MRAVPAETTTIQTETLAPLDFDAVYGAQFDYVYRVIVRLAGRTHAEDLTQEVFAVVHRRLDEFEGRAKLTTWLFQIAYRVVGAHIRGERLRRLLLGGMTRSEAGIPPAALRGLEQAEDDAALARAVAGLPWKKRAVLVLHEVEGWPGDLIAERMGIPVATVWTRLHHARKALATALRCEAAAGESR